MDRSKNANDILILPDKDDATIKSFKQLIQVSIHHFYIVDEISEVDRYLDLINVLKTAEQHDTIFIYLNTPGGMLNTTIQIISAMKQSNATIITCLEGEVCSAGTMIFLSGNKFLVNPNCTFMIHNYSAGVSGKGNEIAAQAEYRGEYAKELMKDIYQDFLTKEEIAEILSGRDIWLNSDQVIKRLGNKSVTTEDIDMNAVLDELPDLIETYIQTKKDKNKEELDKKGLVPEKSKPAKKTVPKKK